MKNRGFTLVELLGVIVLIGILSVIIVPKINGAIDNSKKQAYNVQLESIKKGANDYIVKGYNMLGAGDVITIKLGMLKQLGYLPVDVKNPITRKNFSNDSMITISYDGFSYSFFLNMFDVIDVDENISNNSPIITLNGNYIEYVTIGGKYTELGASAISSLGDALEVGAPQIMLGDTEVLSIDTSSLNTYSVIYEATDLDGNSSSSVRTVVVVDDVAPVINVPKETVLHTSEVYNFDLMQGVVVTDNYDSNPTILVDSNLSDVPGKYVISYTASDSNGNSIKEVRVVRVENTLNNAFTYLDYIESTGTQYINLLYYPTPNTGIFADFQFVSISAQARLYGVETDSTGLTDFLTYCFYINGSSKFAYAYHNANGNWVPIVNADTNRHVLKFNVLDDKRFSFDDNVYSVNGGATNVGIAPLYLFSRNYSNGNRVFYTNAMSNIKLYGFKIYERGILVRDFHPCQRNNDSVVGLCDSVGNSFYENSGTGSFEFGFFN